MQENMRRRVLIAQNWVFEPYGNLLTPRANMNAPIRDAFECSSRKPRRRHFVSGFPGDLLSLSQEKSSGVEIASQPYVHAQYETLALVVALLLQSKGPY